MRGKGECRLIDSSSTVSEPFRFATVIQSSTDGMQLLILLTASFMPVTRSRQRPVGRYQTINIVHTAMNATAHSSRESQQYRVALLWQSHE